MVEGERGPTGGPAFTDVLGVCAAWTDTDCVVMTADGNSVTIPRRLIVSGKPVPPRASRYSRLSRADVEARVGSQTPAGEVFLIGSVAQLSRALREVTSSERVTVRLDGDWAELIDVHRPADLAAAVEWAAEQGALTVWQRTRTPQFEEFGLVEHHRG